MLPGDGIGPEVKRKAVTRDLGGSARTIEMAKAIAAALD